MGMRKGRKPRWIVIEDCARHCMPPGNRVRLYVAEPETGGVNLMQARPCFHGPPGSHVCTERELVAHLRGPYADMGSANVKPGSMYGPVSSSQAISSFNRCTNRRASSPPGTGGSEVRMPNPSMAS